MHVDYFLLAGFFTITVCFNYVVIIFEKISTDDILNLISNKL